MISLCTITLASLCFLLWSELGFGNGRGCLNSRHREIVVSFSAKDCFSIIGLYVKVKVAQKAWLSLMGKSNQFHFEVNVLFDITIIFLQNVGLV